MLMERKYLFLVFVMDSRKKSILFAIKLHCFCSVFVKLNYICHTFSKIFCKFIMIPSKVMN